MTLELRILGPDLDTVRFLGEGDGELVLGRDADCSVRLPDPQRNVSRRHLALWNEADQLHFRVLSVVNGVEMPFGEAPPGAQGLLPVGQVLKVGDYAVEVRLAVAPAITEPDPWAVLDAAHAPEPQAGRARVAQGAPAQGLAVPLASEDDPFGDWGFESSFGPGSGTGTGTGTSAGLHAAARAPVTADIASFFRGLGLDATELGPLTPAEFEAIGRAVRAAVIGLLELHAARGGVSSNVQADDRTMLAVKDNNPLKTDWPEQAKLRYLFGGRAGTVGFVSPERAFRDLIGELLAHEVAVGTATRAAVEGTVREFSPAALKTLLLGGGTRLFEGARAWDAYSRYYAEQSQGLAGWAQRLLDKYFAEAYLRESQRIKRETAPGPKGPSSGGAG
jgi:predicted component of type VI protein secretion system